MMKRRLFVRQVAAASGLTAVGLSIPTGLMATGTPVPEVAGAQVSTQAMAEEPGPDDAQKAFMALEFGMFIHYGLNTFARQEWGDGTSKLESFTPKSIDTDQWARTARAAGMKYMVLTTKHHDGFCNWPTKQTDYHIGRTPYGKDLVGQLADSCKRHGLAFGIYYSLWDRREPLHDKDEFAYVEFMKRQMHELLTQYGPIATIWFDGFWKKQQSGWKRSDGEFSSPETMMAAWRNEGAYRWQMDHLYQYCKQLQQGAIIFNNPTTKFPGVPLFPCDGRPGEKYLKPTQDQKIWEFAGKRRYLPLQIETTMSTGDNEQFDGGRWFYHPEDHTVMSVEQVRELLAAAKTHQANVLLNCGPGTDGRLRPEDERVLLALNRTNGSAKGPAPARKGRR